MCSIKPSAGTDGKDLITDQNPSLLRSFFTLFYVLVSVRTCVLKGKSLSPTWNALKQAVNILHEKV